MTELLDRVTRINIPVSQKRDLAGKVRVLQRAEIFDPRISRIYLSDVSEVPDHVKNHPLPAQRAYLVTFNNVLAKTGDQSKAMRAGAKAVRTKLSQLQDMKRRMLRKGGVDEGLIHWHVKRAIRGPQVQIVVP